MPKCCISFCPNSLRQNKGIAMFVFPRDVNLREKWLQAVNVDPNMIGENTRVCCSHFVEDDIFTFATKKTLKRGRIPHVNLQIENIEQDTKNIEQKHVLEEYLQVSKSPNAQSIKKPISRIKKFTTQPRCYIKSRFLIENFMKNDRKIFYYTGIQQFNILLVVYNFVFESEKGSPGRVHQSSSRKLKQKRHKLSQLNEFFLTLMKLRRGFNHKTLADMFNIPIPAVSSIFTTWINLMYRKLGSINIFPHKNVLLDKATPAFLRKYPKAIGSINCIEFNIQTRTSLDRESKCFSQYRSANTIKSLIMISPTGAIIFISALYPDSISDKEIVEKCGFLKVLKNKIEMGQLEEGDIILADKGLNVRNLLKNLGVELNIPTFRITGMQFQPDEEEYMRQISHERIHVERAICRLKSFKILSQRIPIFLLDNVNQIYTVCALLTNFRLPPQKK